jgi:guanine deaminase
MDSMRQALIASKVVHIDSHLPSSEKNYNALNFAQVFHLATLGGAKVMGLDDKIGNFIVGKQFDALLIDLDIRDGQKPLLLDPKRETACSNFDVFDHDDYLTVFEKFIYLGDDRAISQVYVSGNRIL